MNTDPIKSFNLSHTGGSTRLYWTLLCLYSIYKILNTHSHVYVIQKYAIVTCVLKSADLSSSPEEKRNIFFLPSYLWMNSGADLSESQRQIAPDCFGRLLEIYFWLTEGCMHEFFSVLFHCFHEKPVFILRWQISTVLVSKVPQSYLVVLQSLCLAASDC